MIIRSSETLRLSFALRAESPPQIWNSCSGQTMPAASAHKCCSTVNICVTTDRGKRGKKSSRHENWQSMSEDGTPHTSLRQRRGLSLPGMCYFFQPAASNWWSRDAEQDLWMEIRPINTVRRRRGDGHISLIHLQYRSLETPSLPRAAEVCKRRPFLDWKPVHRRSGSALNKWIWLLKRMLCVLFTVTIFYFTLQ